jgi:transcriptional regulator with XRE-family HTH domain
MSIPIHPQRIRQLRTQRGYSQERLAEEARLGHRTIQRAEAAKSIHAATAEAIATALNVPVSELVQPPLLSLSPRDLRRELNARFQQLPNETHIRPSRCRVEVIDIESASASEDDSPSVLVTELNRTLRRAGFDAREGTWSEARLLAKVPKTGRDFLYVIHGRKKTFLHRFSSILRALNIGADVVIMSASEVSKQSVRIPAKAVLQYVDIAVAYRAT